MSSHRRRYSKRELLGSLQVDYVMSVADLGLTPRANRWEVLRAFLNRGEARAERLVEDADGFVILQSIPGRANTGAIYVYGESLSAFFWLRFGDREDNLNGQDFQNALRLHRLLRFVGEAPNGVAGTAAVSTREKTWPRLPELEPCELRPKSGPFDRVPKAG